MLKKCQKLPSGKTSVLFDELLNYYNGNEKLARQKLAYIFTDNFKKSFGDWEASKLKNTYRSREPMLEYVVGDFSLEMSESQLETVNKIKKFSELISGPNPHGNRYAKRDAVKTKVNGVTEWLATEGSKVFGELMLNFDEEQVRAKMIDVELSKLVADIKTTGLNADVEKVQIDAATERVTTNVDNLFREFKLRAELGTDIHKLTENTVNLSSDESLAQNYRIENVIETYAAASKVIDEIKRRHPGAKLMTEQLIAHIGKVDFAGVADLIVILPNGKAVIYDWKSSTKQSDQWTKAKNLTIQYQLGMYRAMLEAAGIEVEGTYIIPSSFTIVDGKAANIEFDSIRSIPSTIYGSISQNIDSIIPHIKYFQNAPVASNEPIKKFLKDAINEEPKARKTTISDKEIETFVKKKKDKGLEEFINPYATDTDRKISLDDKAGIRKYLLEDAEARLTMPTQLWKTVEEARTMSQSRRQSASFLNGSIGKRYEAIRKYVEDFEFVEEGDKVVKDYRWQPILSDEANEMGLLLMYNKKTNVIEVIATTGEDMDEPREMTLGKTLAGNFLSGNREKEAKFPPATEGNSVALKTTMFLLHNSKLIPDNAQIGNISIISSQYWNAPKGVLFKEYRDYVSKLVDLSGEKMPEIKQRATLDFGVDSLSSLMDYIDMLIVPYHISQASDENREIQGKKLKELREELTKAASNSNEVERILVKRMNELIAQNIQDSAQMKNESGYLKRRELELITEFIKSKHQLEVYSNADLATIGSLYMSENSWVSLPDDITKEAIRTLISIQKVTNNNIRQRFVEQWRDSHPQFIALHSKVGLITKTLSGKQGVYKNLFEYKKVGDKWVNTFVLRDPVNDKAPLASFQKPLIKEEKELIQKFMQLIAKIRTVEGRELGPREVPLMRSTAQSKFVKAFDTGKKSIKDAVLESVDDFINPMDAIQKDRSAWETKMEALLELYDTFDYAEGVENRLNLLTENPDTDFEDDLELILNAYTLNHIKKDENAKVLPQMNAIRASIMMADMKLYKSFPEIANYVEMLMKQNLYGMKASSDEQAQVMKYTEKLKSIASTGLIGLSISTASINLLTNLWQTNSALIGIASDRVSYSNFMKAFTFVTTHAPETWDMQNFLDELNNEYGFHQMEVSRLGISLRRDKQGFKNFERHMHFMNSYPDFMFRAALFLGEALEEGTFKISGIRIAKDSAINWDGKRVTYDPAKDIRFSELFKAKPNTESDDYKRQKSLYDNLKEDLDKEYRGVQEDKIVRAYASRDMESKKKIANLLYQEDTSENKTKLERTALGSLFMMFKRWMLSKKNIYYKQYVSAEENIVAGKRVSYKDTNGEWKTTWQGKPMEGILQSVYFTFSEIARTKSFIQAGKNLSDYQIRNLRHLGMDMFQYAVITAISSALMSEKKDEKKKWEQKLLRILNNSGRDLFIFNTWTSVSGKNNSLVAVNYMNTILGNMLETLYDGTVKGEISDRALRNVGVYRNLRDYAIDPLLE